MIKRTLSITKGKGSVGHNSRAFFAENVDQTRTPNNRCYINQDIKEVYQQLFGEALERYNAKQKRNDRKIENYYEKIRTSKQEKLFHEIIVQVGDMQSMSATGEYSDLARSILDEYMEGFSARNKGLHVFSAYLHMDEATPHLHIDFVPYTTGSKRGLETRVSLKKALEQLGFKSTSAKDTELSQWQNAEKEVLSKIMLAHGVEWEKKGTHREHLSVYDYKKEQRALELEQLEGQVAEKQGEFLDLEEKVSSESKELKSIKQKKVKVKKVEEIQGKSSLTGKKVTFDVEVFEDVKTLAIQKIVENNTEEKWEKELKKAKNETRVAKNESEVARSESKEHKLTIKEQDKEISRLKAISPVLKVTSENSKLKEELKEKDKELTYLRKFKAEIVSIFNLEKVKEFFEKLGLLERIQELIQGKITVKRKEQKHEMR